MNYEFSCCFLVKIIPLIIHELAIVSDRMLIFWNLTVNKIEKSAQTEMEAAAFRRLVSHLQTQTDVQNIDLMILAGFCRNCLAKWLTAAAQEQNVPLDYEEAREQVYGMPYSKWKEKYQLEATAEQLAAYEKRQKPS